MSFQKFKVVDGLNPGPCTKRNRGDIVFLKDLKGKNNLMLLICSKGDEGNFQWSKLANGTMLKYSFWMFTLNLLSSRQ